MSFYAPIETLVSYLIPQEQDQRFLQQNPADIEQPDALENLLGGKVRCLTTILQGIEADIKKRSEISRDVIDRIYLCAYQKPYPKRNPSVN